MTLFRYQPISAYNNAEIDRLFNKSWLSPQEEAYSGIGTWAPRVDIREEHGSYIVHVDVPGMSPEDVKVQLKNNTLTISGSRKVERKDEGKAYSRIERHSGSFCRQFVFPEHVDSNTIKAKMKQGVLELLIPKMDKPGDKVITIIEE